MDEAHTEAAAGPAALAAQETTLAERDEQLAADQRRDGAASVSRWARRLHERTAQSHDRAALRHRDAAEACTAHTDRPA